MNKSLIVLFVGLFIYTSNFAQITIQGSVLNANSEEPVPGAEVIVEGSTIQIFTSPDGSFSISGDFSAGTILYVNIQKSGFFPLRFPVSIKNEITIDLDILYFKPDVFKEQLQMATISLSESDLDNEGGTMENISGLLQSSRDVFLNAAAFDFSQTFFKPRGLDSEYGKVLINGLVMNKIFTGRPQWSNWGGLNDMQRNQEFGMSSLPLDSDFGGIAGSTNIIMRASQYGKGRKVSFAYANRSYQGRIMANYNSGELPGGWFYAISVAGRYANEGYVDGTVYKANSLFLTAEKKINNSHSLNITFFYTPNERGKSSANTGEIVDLKGITYNSYWGIQDGHIRNSRIKEIKEPVFMLNHFWKLGENSKLNTNVSYQFGRVANSRIDYGGTRKVLQPDGSASYIGAGNDPIASYYQKLPSYFLRFPNSSNYEAAYFAANSFKEDGQINWNSLYEANSIALENDGNTIYALIEDRNDDRTFQLNSIYNWIINDNVLANFKITYSNLESENYAAITDMLGGKGYLDIDYFAEGDLENSENYRAQSDLNNPDRLVGINEPFKYHFNLTSGFTEAYANLNFKYNWADFYLAATVSETLYQREGLFQNGSFPENSFGKSEKVDFISPGFKAGITFKLSGKDLVDFNSALIWKAPLLRNVFSNNRQNNEIIPGLENERILSGDLSYIYRNRLLKMRFTGYFSRIKNSTDLSFYYADGLSGLGLNNTRAFVQEILTDISKDFYGVESGIEYQILSTIKLKSAFSVGEFTYSNNPQLSLTSNTFSGPVNYEESYLKNYHLPGGPQIAAQIGFEYRDPNYWWFGTTVNYFARAYADVNALSRTSNFNSSYDGLPMLFYDAEEAKNLLTQEKFDEYYLLNIVGGKSWRIKEKYIGFFLSLNNVLDVIYKTGGFEQSRNSNYTNLKLDRDRELPLFGNKYWYGTGASYYANAYIRF